MHITHSSTSDTLKRPADWLTGDVYIDAVADSAGTSAFAAVNVHFTPGARTAWHTHPHGQTVFVTEGVGLCQREGGPVEVNPSRRPGLIRARRWVIWRLHSRDVALEALRKLRRRTA